MCSPHSRLVILALDPMKDEASKHSALRRSASSPSTNMSRFSALASLKESGPPPPQLLAKVNSYSTRLSSSTAEVAAAYYHRVAPLASKHYLSEALGQALESSSAQPAPSSAQSPKSSNRQANV